MIWFVKMIADKSYVLSILSFLISIWLILNSFYLCVWSVIFATILLNKVQFIEYEEPTECSL